MNLMNYFSRVILFAILSLGITYANYAAPPVRDRILEEVLVTDKNDQLAIVVHFSFPLRYLSHFPQGGGEELRIRLRPVRIPSSDFGAAFQREGVVPRYADTVAVDEVTYEGDIQGGPYLTITFTRQAKYEVIPGPDYRSISIIILSLD